MSKDIIDPISNYLESLGIDFQRYDHPPVFTIPEWEALDRVMPGVHCKNLFMRDNKGKRHYLLCCHGDKQIDIKGLGSVIGQRLGFASERRLLQYLNLKPGSVSPFGLLNDQDSHVQVLVDQDFQGADYLNFHPNINTSTFGITPSDFERYLSQVGNPWQWVDV